MRAKLSRTVSPWVAFSVCASSIRRFALAVVAWGLLASRRLVRRDLWASMGDATVSASVADDTVSESPLASPNPLPSPNPTRHVYEPRYSPPPLRSPSASSTLSRSPSFVSAFSRSPSRASITGSTVSNFVHSALRPETPTPTLLYGLEEGKFMGKFQLHRAPSASRFQYPSPTTSPFKLHSEESARPRFYSAVPRSKTPAGNLRLLQPLGHIAAPLEASLSPPAIRSRFQYPSPPRKR